MTDDWTSDQVRELVSLLQGLAQDAIIAAAETSVAATDQLYPFPMPNTEHPAFAHCADFVRTFTDRDYVQVLRGAKRAAFETQAALYPTEMDLPRATILTRKRVAGMAPAVVEYEGQRAFYTWYAWVDDAGRYVSTDAELVLL